MYTFVYLGYAGDYYKYIFASIAKIKKNVLFCEHPLVKCSLVKSKIYGLLSKFRVDFVYNHYNDLYIDKDTKKHITTQKNICFILSDGLVRDRGIGFIDWLRKEYPNSKIVYQLTDTVQHNSAINPQYDIREIVDNCDLAMSYNESDANKYGLILERAQIIDYSMFENTDSETIDVFFVGQSKGRLKKIVDLFRFLTGKGLNCQFYLVGVPLNEQIMPEQIHYSSYIPYVKVCDLVSRSRCILNLIQKGACGITLRDYEAIGFNKFLITDNPSIFNSPFYTEQKVINADNIENEIEKIYNDDMIEWNGKNEYSVCKYYEWLSGLLKSK